MPRVTLAEKKNAREIKKKSSLYRPDIARKESACFTPIQERRRNGTELLGRARRQ